jgi:hypothetical protein
MQAQPSTKLEPTDLCRPDPPRPRSWRIWSDTNETQPGSTRRRNSSVSRRLLALNERFPCCGNSPGCPRLFALVFLSPVPPRKSDNRAERVARLEQQLARLRVTQDHIDEKVERTRRTVKALLRETRDDVPIKKR